MSKRFVQEFLEKSLVLLLASTLMMKNKYLEKVQDYNNLRILQLHLGDQYLGRKLSLFFYNFNFEGNKLMFKKTEYKLNSFSSIVDFIHIFDIS